MKGRIDLLEQIRQQSIKARSQALIKEQQERYMGVKLAPGSSASGGGRSGCYPPGGVFISIITNNVDVGSFRQDLFLAALGTRSGRPKYEWFTETIDGGDRYRFIFSISWNGSLWELILEVQTPEGDQSEIGATSAELYGVWTTFEGEDQFEVLPGTGFQCEYRYCASAAEIGGDGSNFAPFMIPVWINIPFEDFPNGYITTFGEGGVSIVWIEGQQQWRAGDGLNTVELGGTRDSLPAGTFEYQGAEVTISEGFCDPNQNPNA